MTGFGVGDATLGQGRLWVELRSLNHRFVDVRVRMPNELSDQAFFLEQLCRGQLGRGRYDVSVRLEGPALPPPELDLERGKAIYKALGQLRDEVAPGTELPVSVLTSMPQWLQSGTSLDPEPAKKALSHALEAAKTTLLKMRETEGRALREELDQRLSSARKARAAIEEQVPRLLQAHRQRLQERVADLLNPSGAEPNGHRLEMELALIAERSDIAEELARLDSHFDQFEQLCQEDGAVGRKLDFLLQEIGRETNTIGSKCQDVDLSQWVVQLKAEVERLREQVQNVE